MSFQASAYSFGHGVRSETAKSHQTKMPISYDKIVQSPVFRFLIGKHQKPMTIHTALAAEQSPTLRNMVVGFMEEAQTGTAVWQDIDEGTFARFAQFVYTGDYTPPSWNEMEDSRMGSLDRTDDEPIAGPVEVTHAEGPEPESDVGLSNKKSPKEKRRTRYSTSSARFYDLDYPPPTSSNIFEICKRHPNQCSTKDYTPILLGHARLYVFAEKYGIKDLQAMVLHKLHSTLCKYSPCEARYGDVIELVKYTYKNTPCRRKMDRLRELVMRYLATEAKQIASSEQCLQLVKDGGPFANNLLSMVLERIR